MVRRDGDAAVAQHLLEEILVHRERRGGYAGADVRKVRELEQTLHRPVLAERPVQDRQHDVDRAERRQRPALRRNGQRLRGPCPGARPGPGTRVDGQRLRRACPGVRHQGMSAPVEGPAAVAGDGDAHDLVALRVERCEHRAGRRERDLVLARAAAGEQGHAEPAAHGVVVVVVVAPFTMRPTVSVTMVFGAACVPPCGLWASTIPSELGSVTS